MFDIMLDINKLRIASRNLTVDELQLGVKKLKIVVEEKQLLMKRQEKQYEQLKTICQSLKNNGITEQEINNMLNMNLKKQRKKTPPKYKYTDIHGDERTWTGQGRIPTQIQLQLIKGVPLSDFEI